MYVWLYVDVSPKRKGSFGLYQDRMSKSSKGMHASARCCANCEHSSLLPLSFKSQDWDVDVHVINEVSYEAQRAQPPLPKHTL